MNKKEEKEILAKELWDALDNFIQDQPRLFWIGDNFLAFGNSKRFVVLASRNELSEAIDIWAEGALENPDLDINKLAEAFIEWLLMILSVVISRKLNPPIA